MSALDAALVDLRDSRLMHDGDAADVDAAERELATLRRERDELHRALRRLYDELPAPSNAALDQARAALGNTGR